MGGWTRQPGDGSPVAATSPELAKGAAEANRAACWPPPVASMPSSLYGQPVGNASRAACTVSSGQMLAPPSFFGAGS
jgi:hypothetical protein